MEEMLQRIQKLSKLIQITLNVCIVIFAVIFLVGIVVSVIPCFVNTEKIQESHSQIAESVNLLPKDEEEDDSLFPKDISEFHERIVGSANMLPIDLMNVIFDDTHLVLQVVLSGIFISILAAIFMYLIFELKKIFKYMDESRTPFTMETVKAFRKLSIKTLPICLFITLLGIVIFLAVKLLEFVFEYGTYLQGKADETNRIQEEMIMSFAEITENKSEQTGKHVRRVAEYSRIMAEEMGLGKDRAGIIRLASTMHDIGKLLIPSEILEKPARLTDEEFAMIKKHPGYGGDLLKNVEGDVMKLAKTVALEHHERPDGRGYPEGLKQDSLSLESQIVAVADVYDALTSKRSYKQAWDEKDAYNEIVKGKGTQFGEAVVDAFEKAYADINKVRLQLQE